MSYDQYLVTTMMKGGAKIVPVVVSIVVGYFLFVKLPFWFFRRTLKDARQDFNPTNLPKFPEESKVMKLEEKIRRDAEEMKKEKQKTQQQTKTEQKKEEPKKEQKKEEPKREPPKKPAAETAPTPESVFEMKPGEKFTPEQLKAKHRELIKQSHPDKVASMGPDFRKLAEKKTKEINEAYEKLKKKAS